MPPTMREVLFWTYSKTSTLSLAYTIPMSACRAHFDKDGKPDGWLVRLAGLDDGHPLKGTTDREFVLLPRDECEASVAPDLSPPSNPYRTEHGALAVAIDIARRSHLQQAMQPGGTPYRDPDAPHVVGD